jgi:murein DD-endopeptidase MepM/ murein hydrolase activator NlpD
MTSSNKKAYSSLENDQEVDSLISQLIGTTPQITTPNSSITDNSSIAINNKYYPIQNHEFYSLPVKVGKEGKSLDDGDKPWVVGTFIPGQYVNETHPQGHAGVDLKAPKGTPVYPIASGIVTEAKQYNKGGNTCKVSHENNNVVSYYAHMDTVNVTPGTKVVPTSVLGTVGDTGNAKGLFLKKTKELHFLQY